MDALLTLDGNILLWIQEYVRADWLSPVMLTATKLGNLGLIWIALSLTLLCFAQTRRAGAAGLLALLFSLALNNFFLKNLVARTRPYEVVDGLRLMTARVGDFSFPSGHAGSSFAAATAISMTIGNRRWRWILPVLAAVIALSRLYIGIHYPSDVIVGTITGILCGFAAARIVRRRAQTRGGS